MTRQASTEALAAAGHTRLADPERSGRVVARLTAYETWGWLGRRALELAALRGGQ